VWGEFWRDARLAPQLDRARRAGHFALDDGGGLERVVDRTPELLADVGGQPDLLHGDLWGGNVFPDRDGRPVLIDPALYRGHHEVDLAMSELFGGFPGAWPAAYHEARPIDPGYVSFRRSLYQLYYLLVHVNLFGASYEPACRRAARDVLRAVG
jgi:fructosamine-3-kinase